MKKMIPCHILKNLLIKGNYIMKKLLLSTALAVILTSPAIAEEKSITIVCSDDVEKGTVVLSDPPKMSCEDFDLASRYVGSGFSIGPDTTIEDVKAFLAKWVVQQELKKKQKFQEVSVPPKPETKPVERPVRRTPPVVAQVDPYKAMGVVTKKEEPSLFQRGNAKFFTD